MRGANGLLIIVIGLLILWAVVNGAGPCLGGALACLTKGVTPAARATTTTVPTSASQPVHP
jgi:hypothetical protein